MCPTYAFKRMILQPLVDPGLDHSWASPYRLAQALRRIWAGQGHVVHNKILRHSPREEN